MAEILAPAGSRESLEAAVRSGADAVYLGLKDLSARKNAENFSKDELISAVKYCRQRGVKVYLAVNTLIRDNEWDKAKFAATAAAEAGVDALIVADLGLIRYFGKVVPKIPIHASTQCTVLSVPAAKYLQGLGVKRIVLGRELSKGEIENIRKAVDVELEVFVHGALCMSVSGQCLFSSYLGGRSGNRGLCAAPCRLPFRSDVSGEDFALSLKDNSLYDKISELEAVGVNSYKIEGRMKRPEYVAAAVKSLRDVLDSGSYEKDVLESVFSRDGFTSAYFDGNLKGDLFGKREDGKNTSEAEVFPKIHEFYKKERQSVGLSGAAKLSESGFMLTLSDGKNSVSLETKEVSFAKTVGIKEDFIKEKISKLGGTPFYLKEIDISLTGGLYINGSEINRLKNGAIEELLELRGKAPKIEVFDYEFSSADLYGGGIQKRYAYLGSTEAFDDFDKIFTDISKYRIISKDKAVIVLPRYFSPDKERVLREQLKQAYKEGVKYAAADNLNSLGLLLDFDFEIIGTMGLGVLNSESIKVLELSGVKELILSTENSFMNINSLRSNIPLGVVCYGYTPLMLLRACPIRGKRDCVGCRYKGGELKDRKGLGFKVRCKEEYSELLNNRPLYIIDREDKIRGAKIAFYDLTEEKALGETADAIKNKKGPKGEFTVGLYENKLL